MKKFLSKCDIPLFIITLLLCAVGVIMVFSSSNVSTVLRYHVSPYHFFIRQLLFLTIGFLVGFFIIVKIPTRKYKYFSSLLIIGVIAALIGLFAYGKLTNSALSWYNFGPISLQPSEFAKTGIIIFMATFYGRIANKKQINIYFIPLIVALIIGILVYLQPDLGSCIIILGITFGVFISLPIVKQYSSKFFKIFLIGIVLVLLTVLFTGKSLLNTRQLNRFKFTNPCSRYREDTGYQVCNGFIAMHNGGIFGTGLGNSTQKYLYLPESHTDFIFPIIVEELGLVGGILVVILYVLLLWRILKIAKNTSDLTASILAYGTFIYLLAHILINLLGILALMPLTGVPLPFLSYGGSFTLNVVISIFIVERVAIENNENQIKQTIAQIVN